MGFKGVFWILVPLDRY